MTSLIQTCGSGKRGEIYFNFLCEGEQNYFESDWLLIFELFLSFFDKNVLI